MPYNPETDAIFCKTEDCSTLVNPRIGMCQHCQNEIDRQRKAAEMDYEEWCAACRRGHFSGTFKDWCSTEED
jgi:hypothetical protein